MSNNTFTCPICKGKGTTVNPNIDANGLSAEDFHDDPDFMDDYMGGTFDVSCGACEGSGKINERRIEALQQAAEDRQLAAVENGDHEGYNTAHDWRYGT